MKKSNISVADTKDNLGLSLFHPYNLNRLLFPIEKHKFNSVYEEKCCSRYTISFNVSFIDLNWWRVRWSTKTNIINWEWLWLDNCFIIMNLQFNNWFAFQLNILKCIVLSTKSFDNFSIKWSVNGSFIKKPWARDLQIISFHL